MPEAGAAVAAGQLLPSATPSSALAEQGPPARPAMLELDASHIKGADPQQHEAPGPLVPMPTQQQPAAEASGAPDNAAAPPLAITDGSDPLTDGSITVPDLCFLMAYTALKQPYCLPSMCLTWPVTTLPRTDI